MAPKKKTVRKNKGEINEMTIIATVGVSCCTLSMPNHVTRESRASSVSSVPVSI
ncbi:Kelch-like protein 31 [Myotis davidii]|uniref:Kelch-like protein 31 n=1 Tax=Myotis davidii TaxID=225400 RepID=L5LW57_MYODS|nr:Kelch-like protein 31 [Myotis davidii]